MDEAEITEQISSEMEQTASQRAKDRANAARWDLDVAVFFFSICIIVVILLFQGIGIEVVAPAAVLGLAMGWLMGWRKAKQLYQRFYDEALSKLERELIQGTAEETIEEVFNVFQPSAYKQAKKIKLAPKFAWLHAEIFQKLLKEHSILFPLSDES